MVARIRSGKSLKGAINYNEKKVREGKAELVAAFFYPKQHYRLNFHEKLNRLQNLANLNARAATNCLHLSLNFDPSEKLSNQKLLAIAEAYMFGINFGSQPYLVYHHHDAAHQHIHIVSTNIQRDGKRISLHNLGRGLSEKTRKEIEVKFNLVRADGKQQTKLQLLKPVKTGKVIYGKDEVKRAITNVVNLVISQYKFASIAELNAILQLYNIIADRGAEGTRMFEKNGLQYCLLNSDKEKIGVPIKSSSIYGKPTLKLLEKKFESCREEKQQLKSEVKARIKGVLALANNKESFGIALKNENIDVVWRINKDNFIYGVTYVDHHTKSIFNGSELGKEMSAAAIQAGWENKELKQEHSDTMHHQETASQKIRSIPASNESILGLITDPAPGLNYLPQGLKKKRKKKKVNQSRV